MLLLLANSVPARAEIMGTVRGVVHDPQHRPIRQAQVALKAKGSDWTQVAKTSDVGEFEFGRVPLGEYRVEVSAPGFAPQEKPLSVVSGSAPILHFELAVATVEQKVNVSASSLEVAMESARPQTTVSKAQIAQTPGADDSNSLAMITDFVPGAVLVHNQLHVRGGHQVTWEVDGVPIPNTNIASNVGPQFNPKDVEYVEVQRGAYSAEFGDRAYGVFNVVPRSGFERSREGEIVLGYGSYNTTDNQISFGDHTNRFAYYASLNGNRTDQGLETPAPQALHDQAAGIGGFTSLTFNATKNDQLRFVASERSDSYQVPNDPGQQAGGVRDRDREQDAFANLTWLHSFSPSVFLSVSPLYHFNRAAFEGGRNDVPIATDNRASTYAGGQASLAIVRSKHNAKVGFLGIAQRDDEFFSLIANDGSGMSLRQRVKPSGDLEAVFFEDQYKPASWLTLTGGLRFTRFSGALTQTAGSPRAGAAIRLPRIHWVLRGSYDRYYQAPPLSTVSGPLLQLALNQGFGFLPLRGERDEQYDLGLTVPIRGWTAEFDYFHTGARNFFDHDALGGSNVFFPLTIDQVRIRGYEVTVRSPRIFRRVQAHLAYSNQTVQGQGGVTGGLTDFSPPGGELFFLDHDQRHTLTVGVHSDLPWKSWVNANFNYGSGFLNGDGPFHLPSHETADLAIGRSFGERWSARLSATNLTNSRYLLDLSNTFGGSHYVDPRRVSLQIRYRFRY